MDVQALHLLKESHGRNRSAAFTPLHLTTALARENVRGLVDIGSEAA
jgi:hypothetical protein